MIKDCNSNGEGVLICVYEYEAQQFKMIHHLGVRLSKTITMVIIYVYKSAYLISLQISYKSVVERLWGFDTCIIKYQKGTLPYHIYSSLRRL